MVKAVFKPGGFVAECEEGSSLLEMAGKAGVKLESICGGRGLCGKCKVQIISMDGGPPPPTPQERKLLTEEQLERGYRLACLVKPKSNALVYVPPESRRGLMRLQAEGLRVEAALKPAVRKHAVKVPKATLEDQRSDDDRLLEALAEERGLKGLTIRLDALRRLPSALREGGWTATAVTLNDREVISVEPGDTSGEVYGVAVDVGTTKIAVYLLDLVNGRELAAASALNPQRIHGEDVMTRMAFANRSKRNLLELHRLVVGEVNKLVEECCVKAGVDKNKVYEAVFVGNTVMHHFLLGLETKYLSLSPYAQALRRPIDCSPTQLGLKINKRGNVHALPTIRSFVGADNVAVCLVTNIMEAEKPTLALDIGTNTEVDCGSRSLGLVVTSTPSGPAFEGWSTKWGMTASKGAIERVFIEPEGLEVMYRTVGDAAPVGICGSGYVDAIAEMMKVGILDHRSRFNPNVGSKSVRKGEDGYELVVAPKEESGVGKDIVVTQRDVGEIIKAKAAIHAAITLLLDYMGLGEEEIDRLLLAGAFGSYMNPESARTIGMLPDLELNKIIQIGNAAGSGAKLALLNVDERRRAEEISAKAKFVELATHPRFVKEYANSMYLPYKDLGRYPRTMAILGRVTRGTPSG